MGMDKKFDIVVLPGDGIGVEVIQACLAMLDTLQKRVGGFALALDHRPGGASSTPTRASRFPTSR